MNFIKVDKRSIFNIHGPVDLKLLTRLCLNFDKLIEDKFRHDFRDNVSPMCNCGPEIESTKYLLSRSLFFTAERNNLFNPLSTNSTKWSSTLKQFIGNII